VSIVNDDELEKKSVGSGRGLILRYYLGIRLEGLRKTTKSLRQDSRGHESYQGPPEYEAGVLTLRVKIHG
jgi:hypothetical protein